MREPLDIAFVWHMHQPYYKISDTGAFEMPWVRMHALKDYADMVEVLAGYPSLHQTFNVVPSLVEQLRDYAAGDYRDTYREHALKPAAELSPHERAFLLEIMCERVTHPRTKGSPRYLELAQKRDRLTVDGTVRTEEFSVEELRDLQVWFDLAWFDPRHLRDGPLGDLAARGRDFTEDDKVVVSAAETRLIARVLPTYRDAADSGAVELTTSPYFHPILPLLINSDCARVSMPAVELPTRRFAHPEDAREHVRLALECHRLTFGRNPAGMWCSEQSVGEDVIGLLAAEGITWTVSDEAVLARSLTPDRRRQADGRLDDPRLLHTAYRLEREEGSLAIVFRDRVLSDLIGFTYQDWDPGDAAADLTHRLLQIREALPDGDRGHVVTIALDGENAWEYYRNDGRDFLERLYERLEAEPALRCVTVSEHLAAHPPVRSLPWLHSGSWIGGDFGTWLGDTAHRRAWDLLHDARDAVAAVRAVREVETAWREIMIAEGSDWFWWFSDHQESGLDHVWDATFRRHLQQAYRLAGLDPPASLFEPVLPGTNGSDGYLTANVDGALEPPDEWRRGLPLRPTAAGVMQRAAGLPVNELRFGWDADHLFFLVEPAHRAAGLIEVVFFVGSDGSGGTAELADSLGFRPAWALALTITTPAEASISGDVAGEAAAGAHAVRLNDAAVRVAGGRVVEAAVPWEVLQDTALPTIRVGAALFQDGARIETFPSTGAVAVRRGGV
ncbi:MAG: glycoside hydrolase [Thermoleophilia bacterium]